MKMKMRMNMNMNMNMIGRWGDGEMEKERISHLSSHQSRISVFTSFHFISFHFTSFSSQRAVARKFRENRSLRN